MTQPNQPHPSFDRLISRRQLRDHIDVSDMTIWRWQRAGTFPRHTTINGRNYWRMSDIMAWIERQCEAACAQSGDGK